MQKSQCPHVGHNPHATPTPHTDLCLLRCRQSYLYWLWEGRRLTDRLTCPTKHMRREHTTLWGNLRRSEGDKCNTDICLVHAYKYTLTCAHTHTSLVHSPYFYSNFRIKIGTGYEATSTSMHVYSTHTPVFAEIQVVPYVLVVGGMKADGQVELLHWTHGEGSHLPVGEAIPGPLRRV